MKNLLHFLFPKEKAKAERKQEIDDQIHARKNKFTSDMLLLQKQAKKVHQTSLKSLEESKKLNIIVSDIASQIALATPGGRKRKYE